MKGIPRFEPETSQNSGSIYPAQILRKTSPDIDKNKPTY
jgi:hypothetical protein